MKHIILACALLSFASVSYAQTSTDYDRAKAGKKHASNTDNNPFLGTEMTATKELVSFASLPEVPKPTWAIITNTEGEFIKESKVNATYNAVDIHRLPKGLYFVTLVYRNRNRKAFTLNVGE